ncbi:hypothetical protein DFH09DRAFT_1088045 [Mycena vulgaris]|nr:hypothetical protein DFH09DRAFT_1088045 [Mycena vulgaris]
MYLSKKRQNNVSLAVKSRGGKGGYALRVVPGGPFRVNRSGRAGYQVTTTSSSQIPERRDRTSLRTAIEPSWTGLARARCDKDRGATGLYRMVSSLERVAVEKQNIEILVQIGAGRETECVNPPSRGFRGGFNVDKSWSYGDGVAWKVCTGTLGEEWGKTLAQELTDYWLKWVVLLYLFRLYTAFGPHRTIDLP